MHFVIVGALPQSLTNFRGDLIRAVIGHGHRVTAMSAPATDGETADIMALGADFRSYPVERTGLNPISDARTLVALRGAFQALAPDVVLAYTIKPVIWSGIALRSCHSHARYFALVTGLGYAFEGNRLVQRGIQSLASGLYRCALSRAQRVIFQNRDNRDIFTTRGIVPAEKCRVVSGSGVDTNRFSAMPLPVEGSHFMLIARLLGDKGLREYVEAARLVRVRYPNVTFHLVGPVDPSPDGIPLSVVQVWHDSGDIVYHGSTNDVRPHIAAGHIYVLPSYHEGMPRSVLEAMAMGRPILTTDVPGCRETVLAGENGWLVPRRDSAALAERIEWFLTHRAAWDAMGARSRQLALERFDVHAINGELLRIMGLRGGNETGV